MLCECRNESNLRGYSEVSQKTWMVSTTTARMIRVADWTRPCLTFTGLLMSKSVGLLQFGGHGCGACKSIYRYQHAFHRSASFLLCLTTLLPRHSLRSKLIPIPREVRARCGSAAGAMGCGLSALRLARPRISLPSMTWRLTLRRACGESRFPVNIWSSGWFTIELDLPVRRCRRHPRCEMPEEMKAEGYAIIPDGKGLTVDGRRLRRGLLCAADGEATGDRLRRQRGAAHGEDSRLAGDEVSRAG